MSVSVSRHVLIPFHFVSSLSLSSQVDRVKEVQFSGGVAGASSFHPANNWRPENAFTRQRAVDGGGWSGGPSDSRSYSLPLSVWYDFKSRSVRAAEVGFLGLMPICQA